MRNAAEGLILLDIQHFAGDEDENVVLEDLQEDDGDEDDETGTPGGEEEDGTGNENQPSDDKDAQDASDETGQEGDQAEDGHDKKDAALIKYKREAKEYKKKLDELEKQAREKEKDAARSEKKKELIDSGYSQDDAERIARIEIENQTIKQELRDLRFEKLEKDYPGISNYKKEISELADKYPDMSESELYLAKYASRSGFDAKTTAEQEMLYKQSAAKSKAGTSGTAPERDTVKLGEENEKAFKILKERDPTWTRKKFLEFLE